MDVKTAFLNGEISETVYMKQPEGFQVKGKEDYVCRLTKSLYGLKQAARAWNNKLDQVLKQLGFNQSQNEPCVYTRNCNGKIIILAVYVDDMLLFWNDINQLKKVKRELTSKFEMKDLGEAKLILGMRITQDSKQIKVDQEKYVDQILIAYDMQDCKPVATPTAPGQNMKQSANDRKSDQKIPYRELLGSLMYLSVCTRPDIAHSVNYLSQFNECYEEEHWIAAKRVLRHLKGTKNLGLKYLKAKGQQIIEGYADANFAGDSDRRPYSGSVFLVQGGAVSWQSTKQRTVALSTAEAEYVSMSEAAKEAVFLKRFIGEMAGWTEEKPLIINSDSQSAIAIANDPVYHQRTKHVDVRYHFIRQMIDLGEIQVEYCATERMIADALTKALPRGKFEWCVNGMELNV